MNEKKHHHSTDKVMSRDVKPDQENSEKKSPNKTIGAVLRDEREKKGLSYAQVSEITKVRQPILEALENESWDKLPSPVFISGFVRSYGRTLGLDEEKIMALYQESGPVKISPPKPLSEPVKSKKASFIMLVFLLLAMSSFYFLWKGFSIRENPEVIPKKISTVEIEPKKSESSQESHNSAMVKPPSKQDQPDPEIEIIDDPDLIKKTHDLLEEDNKPIKYTAPVESTEIIAPELILKAIIREETWVKIFIDDKDPREYIFQPGRRFQWTAEKGFELMIGNAAGIDLKLNGEKVEKPTTAGQVIHVTIPEDYERESLNRPR